MSVDVLVMQPDEFAWHGSDSFKWEVCRAGYEWRWRRWAALYPYCVKSEDVGHVLFPKDPSQMETRSPLQTPLLFRELASIPIDLESIRLFAEKYGLLGMCCAVTDDGPAHPSLGDEGYAGEAQMTWKYVIIELRAAIKLWDAIVHHDAKLHRHFGRYRDFSAATARAVKESAPARDPERWTLLGGDDDLRLCYMAGLWDLSADDELQLDCWAAAETMLVQLCNKAIEQHCGPYLYRRTSRATTYSPGMVPKDLFGAVWWQFAKTVVGESRCQPCKICGRPIEHSKEKTGHRTDMAYCSNACKLKQHRARVKRARQLKAKGKSVREIASALGSKPKAIRKWLTKPK
jgi:hypothetical protein